MFLMPGEERCMEMSFNIKGRCVDVLTIRQRLRTNIIFLYTKIKMLMVDFCRTTSFQGLRHVVVPHYHPVERLFWSVMFMLMSYSCITLCTQQLNRYFTRPTVVSVKRDFRNWTITYPAVTACVTDIIQPYFLEDYILKKWNVTMADEEKYEYYSGLVELVVTVSFRTNLRLFWRYENDPTVAGMDLMEMALSVNNLFSIETSTHDLKHRVFWDPVMTEMGLCKTFNSKFSKYQSLESRELLISDPNTFSIEVTDKELLSCNYMNKQCWAKFKAVNHTANFYIHSPWEIVDSRTSNTGNIEDQEIKAEYRVLQMSTDADVIKLGQSQRRCKYPQEKLSTTIPAYSNGLCQMDCRTRMSMVFCGCKPYFITIGNFKSCDVNGMACIGKTMEILVNLPTNLAKCQCVPQCTEINYIPHDKKLIARNSTDDLLMKRRASLHLSLQMPKILMNKSIIFTFEDLIGSFGGVCALFLGISFMSLMELIIFCLKPLLQ